MSAANVTAAVRRSVSKIDKDLPIDDVKKMPEELEESVAQPRFGLYYWGCLPGWRWCSPRQEFSE